MKIKDFFNKIIKEKQFRWYALAVISFALSVLFAVYNLVVGVIFNLVWNFSVSFYYLFLALTKAIILYKEFKWRKLNFEDKTDKRTNLIKTENVFLLVIDFFLIAPIILMLLQKKPSANFGMIFTIAMATYTTYKIVIACINYTSSQKTNNLTLHGLKVISLKEAIVSIVTLQNTMILVFGDFNEMLLLSTCTSIGMYLSLLIISIYQFIKLKKLKA